MTVAGARPMRDGGGTGADDGGLDEPHARRRRATSTRPSSTIDSIRASSRATPARAARSSRDMISAVVLVGQVEDRHEVERVAGGAVRRALDRLLDRGEREAAVEQLADELQALQVLAVVVARASREPRRLDEAAAGVGADVAHRHLRRGPRARRR